MNDLKNSTMIVFFVCLYSIYAYLSVNMVLPALPNLANQFHTAPFHVKLSVTLLLVGYSVAQLIWGILSDKYGRRSITLIAISITIVGSIISGLSNSILLFSLARFVEGLGSGFGPSLGRIIANDALKNKKLHACIVYLVSIIALMPAIAPIVGGQIMTFLGWRGILFSLALIGIAIYCLSYFYLPETKTSLSHSISVQKIMHDFYSTATNKMYMRYFLAYSFMLAGFISFYFMAPYMFITTLHISASSYGWILLFVGGSYMLGSLANGQLIHYLSRSRLIEIGYAFSFFSILLLIVFYFTIGITIVAVIVPACIFGIACGFISPVMNAIAMENITGDTGIPISLLGCGVMVITAISTSLLSNFTYDTLLPMLFTFIVLAMMSVVFYLCV